MTEERILELVREQLRKHHPGGVSLDVIEGDVTKRDDYWYVGVRPSTQPPKMYEYYEALADVEETLAENEQIEVFLRPSLPEEPVQSDQTAPSGVPAPGAQQKRKPTRRIILE